MNITAGKVLQNGKYLLDATLGQGGFGITYKATHTYLGQPVAIKTLQDSLRHQEEFGRFQQQFIAEAQRLAKCQHPNIVRVLDFFEEDGLFFIVMDYIPGPTLAEAIVKGERLSEALAIHYIRQIGSALSLVHQNGLLHRDVKPQNIILKPGSNTVILIDFGIAREFTPGITQTHTGILSPGYAPIEQYLPRGKRSAATDVYGIAATLYSLLTGQPPVAAVLRDRIPLTNPRQLRPDLSPAVEQAIWRGLEMEAERRPQTVEAWLALLPNSDESIPEVSFPSIPATQAPPDVNGQTSQPKPAERWGWLALGVTAVLAAIAGISFGLTLRFGNDGKPLLQQEQTFPPTDKWPTAEPIAPPSPTPTPKLPVNSLPKKRSNTSVVRSKPVVSVPRYRPKLRKRSSESVRRPPSPQPQPTPTPESTSSPSPAVSTQSPEPSPSAVTTPNPAPVETPATVIAPSALPSPTTEPSTPQPPVVQPLPPIPAAEAAAPIPESSPAP